MQVRSGVRTRRSRTQFPRIPVLSAALAGMLTAAIAAAGPAAAAAPVAVDDAVSTARNARVAVSMLANDTDADGDRLSLVDWSAPAHGSVICRTATSVCIYTPATAYEGPDAFTYTVADGHGGRATATVRITVDSILTGRAPVAGDDPVQTAEGTPVTFDVLANDTDPDGDRLTLIWNSAGSYGTPTCATDGRCTYTPDAGFAGPDSFGYQVSDGRGGVGEATVRVTVRPTSGRNHAPAASLDQVTTVVDHEVAFDILANDVDADGDPLTPSLVGQENQRHGVVSCGATGPGVCVYRPDPGYVGRDSFGYTVSDGRGGTAATTVSIFVYSSRDDNRPPTAGDDVVSTDEGRTVRFSVTANDTDPDGDRLLVFEPEVPFYADDFSCTAAGSCSYVPRAGFAGPESFTYKVSDGRGGVASATVRVTVRPTSGRNHAPVAVNDSVRTVVNTRVAVAPLANDTDADGDPMTFTVVNRPTHGGLNCDAGTQLCVYSPDTGYTGVDTFDYLAGDGRGGGNEASVTIRVRAEAAGNRDPRAVADTLALDAGGRATVSVLANDSDPDSDPLLVMSTTAPAHGTATCTAAGRCSYVPAAGYSGPDGFGYTVSDGQGGVATGRVDVTVRPVAAPNRAPLARADQLTTTAGTAVAGNVLTNDSDPDGDRLSLTSATTPPNGTVSCTAAGQCSYTPRSGYSGSDSFRYTVSDGRGATATGNVTVTVSAPPAACQPVWWWPLSWLC